MAGIHRSEVYRDSQTERIRFALVDGALLPEDTQVYADRLPPATPPKEFPRDLHVGEIKDKPEIPKTDKQKKGKMKNGLTVASPSP